MSWYAKDPDVVDGLVFCMAGFRDFYAYMVGGVGA